MKACWVPLIDSLRLHGDRQPVRLCQPVERLDVRGAQRVDGLPRGKEPLRALYDHYPDALPAVAKRVHGIQPAPAGIQYNFIKWYVPKGEQKYSR